MPKIIRQDKQLEVQINYEVVGTGDAIVFHHGNGNCIKDWHTLGYVRQLANDFKLILIDSRGYGESSKPHSPSAYSLQSRAEDTMVVLDALKIEMAHCLGASVGASMCMVLAKFYPKRFKSYIFATPYFTQFNDNIKQALLQGPAIYLNKLEELINGKIDNEAVRETFLKNDTKAVWAANSSEWFDYKAYAQYVNAPSLIYTGSEEPKVDELKMLSQRLPNCQFKILPHTDHKTAYWNSRLVAPLIRNFVKQL